MKQHIRKVALITVVILVICQLCGCTSNGGKKSSKDIDLEGHEITIAAWWDDLPSADATDEATVLRYNRMKNLEKKYNCTFKSVVVEQTEISPNFDANMLSGDIFADIIYMRSDSADAYMAKGQFYPVGDIFDLKQECFNDSITQRYTSEGKVYAFSTYDNSMDSLIYFNKNILSRVGLETPYELVKQKKWTWDAFKQYISSATVRSASGSTPEIYGLYGVVSEPYISQMLASLGTEFVHKNENGQYSSALAETSLTDALNYIRELNTSVGGIYVPDDSATWETAAKMFTEGKVAMILGGVSAAATFKETMTDEYGVAPLPLKKEGDNYVSVSEAHNVRVMQSNIDSNMAKKIAVVYSELVAPLYEDKDEALEQERSSYEQRFCDSQSVDLIMEMVEWDTMLFNHMTAAPNSFWQMHTDLQAALRGNTTIAPVVAAYSNAFSEEITRTNSESMK